MQTSHALANKRLVRTYELLWIVYAVAAALVLIFTDFAFALVVVFCLLGIALVFAGMMKVLPENVGDE
jgi:hypothetical protein